ncbi:uncharacterized protein METZ01_LOCUS360915 [marine metagenome]|uniref:YggT family protein n=1 Tax=marine metagenome TaxID=408172 RepID=A0A382SGM9_9ZZZZ
MVFNLLQIIIIVRVVLSWISHNPSNQFIQIIYQVSEPILKPIREILPIIGMGFDLSPIVAFFLLGLLKKILLSVV